MLSRTKSPKTQPLQIQAKLLRTGVVSLSNLYPSARDRGLISEVTGSSELTDVGIAICKDAQAHNIDVIYLDCQSRLTQQLQNRQRSRFNLKGLSTQKMNIIRVLTQPVDELLNEVQACISERPFLIVLDSVAKFRLHMQIQDEHADPQTGLTQLVEGLEQLCETAKDITIILRDSQQRTPNS